MLFSFVSKSVLSHIHENQPRSTNFTTKQLHYRVGHPLWSRCICLSCNFALALVFIGFRGITIILGTLGRCILAILIYLEMEMKFCYARLKSLAIAKLGAYLHARPLSLVHGIHVGYYISLSQKKRVVYYMVD